ncbi:hypothetical protein SLS60_003591 [Paraconiothyrium brasiliense]|uniref:RNase H type-1 domain-containing protein n=1 Tax=Paraconiothyrium brasiliense TaxID=300254 RepID=A0ABR3RP28_9PLEO
MGILDARPASWAIHELDEISRLQSLVAPVDWVSRDRFLDEFGLHFRYSAASLAIRFQQSYPHVAFSQIKKITLLEDHLSIANSPSHAQGLIRFCRQNPGLQIERVVDLWRAGLSPDDFPELPLRTHIITKSFGRWIFEALELRKRGMPNGSFRLILDGSPLPEKASQVFEAVKSDAARQAARDLCYARNILPCPSWFQRRNRVAYQWEGLHQAITSLQNGDYASFIDCNFDLGAAHDPECTIGERLDWTADDWTENELAHMRQQFDTEAPLPPWQELHPISPITHLHQQLNRNFGLPLGKGPQTNNRAELMAIYEALRRTPIHREVIIRTDSETSKKCLEGRYKQWRLRSFK